MTTTVFFAVLFAALLHATWNALLRGGSDKTLSMTAVVVGHVPFALLGLCFVPAPAPESWPLIGLSLVFHLGYQIFLMNAYKIGDLTQVYPIARGTAPLLVAGVSTVFLGVELMTLEILAILTIGTGLLSLALARGVDGLRDKTVGMLAFATGCFIAGYSLVDGTGARLAGTSLGFYGWQTILNAVIFSVFIRIRYPGTLSRLPTQGRAMLLLGGGGSFVAYAIVTWAFTQVPIALVTALRETSIIFALVIGTVFLGERMNVAKAFSIFVTLLGAVMLRLARW